MMYDTKYKFNETWFDNSIELWNQVFDKFKDDINIENVLEIGCYEGRATVYLCEKVLKANANYDVVDTFGGSEAESGMKETMNRLDKNNNIIYDNFKHNISFFKDINFNIHRGISQQILPTLVDKERQYDFVYVDASHRADDTFVDAYYANKMLKDGGLLIFDDFGWKDPAQPELVSSPEFGIRTFATMYQNIYDTIATGYQIVLRKKSNENIIKSTF